MHMHKHTKSSAQHTNNYNTYHKINKLYNVEMSKWHKIQLKLNQFIS